MIERPAGHSGLEIRIGRDGRVWVNDEFTCLLRAGPPADLQTVRVLDDRVSAESAEDGSSGATETNDRSRS